MKKTTLSSAAAGSTWHGLAAHLLTVEKVRSWSTTHSSFSSWLADLARALQRSEATLWRALSAGRYYAEIREELVGRGVEIPELGAPAVAASPEALELAQKISRVAPDEVVQQISRKVIEGAISRRELRTYWETYRPVLNGQTARGRNVEAPQFDPDSAEMLSSRAEADCVAGLIHGGSGWLGCDQAHIYKVIPVSSRTAVQLGCRHVPDVIVLYQATPNEQMQIHGIEAATRLKNNAVVRHYRTNGLGVDRFWIIAPDTIELRAADSNPEIGVLQANPRGVHVTHQAGPAKQDRDETLVLMRGLLARQLGA